MPAAREALLEAAFAALASRPWARIRMTDVAASAGVSRQTLYNEFGGKDGLALALVRREAERYLSGVERALTGVPGAAGPGERLAAAAVWTVRAGTENPLVRAVLTGCWNERLPSPVRPAPAGGPARSSGSSGSSRSSRSRRAAAGEPVPTPVDLLGQARDRAVRLLAAEWPPGGPVELARACDTAARLALSYVLVPAPAVEVASAVRGALAQAAR
ncbi:TetR/AcrR family transcriptional regulator [Streptomyces sp. NPDC059850]|uniref:TetR/AcrR family transcriptional regulator n=1 Tax=Streptomyces sp. NPDC059850 TaxID=3346970 RepID=UPI003658578B